MALISSWVKKIEDQFSKGRNEFKTNKKRSESLLKAMEQKLEKESKFRLLFAAVIIFLVIINPLLISLIASLGFIGSLLSSLLGSLTFLNALEPLYSGILVRLVRKPITFFIIGMIALLIGFNPFILLLRLA